jgi:hypothetical protein
MTTETFGIDYSGLPEHLRHGVQAYVEHGREMGHFLTAVAEDDLFGAMFRADHTSRHRLYNIAIWFWNEPPSGCFGSKSRVADWQRKGGLQGISTHKGATVLNQELKARQTVEPRIDDAWAKCQEELRRLREENAKLREENAAFLEASSVLSQAAIRSLPSVNLRSSRAYWRSTKGES